MKRFKLFALIVTFLLCVAVAFAGCTGPAEQSADTGNGGQLSEAMLMYNEARAAGYGGSYLDFLAEYAGWLNGGNEDDEASDDTDGEQTDDEREEPVGGIGLAAMSVVNIKSDFTVGLRHATQAGAGVIYSIDPITQDAYIITNYHVVYNSDSSGRETVPHVSDNISLWLYGGDKESGEITAAFIGGAIDYDVAVLYAHGSTVVYESGGVSHTNASVFENSGARAVTTADSDGVTIGDEVYAIGNPAGYGISVTKGTVSVEAEYINMTAIDNSFRTIKMLEIRTDAAINHGNSGGGLFNDGGELVGITNARLEETGVQAFGYAIPSNLVTAIACNVIDAYLAGVGNYGGSLAVLGAGTKGVSHSYYDEQTGASGIVETVTVVSILRGTAAENALQAGDVLLSATLHGEEKLLTREYMLSVLLFDIREGDELTFRILREGEETSVTVQFSWFDFNNFN